MREVSKQEFWNFIMTTQQNIHPSPEREVTYWKNLHTHALVGKSYPGYLLDGPEKFYLMKGNNMKAILTKVVPCTNTKPTRIKAYTEGGNSIMVSWSECDGEGDRTQEQAHMYAARKLCDKMGWGGKLIGGETLTGYCFVFQNSLIKE